MDDEDQWNAVAQARSSDDPHASFVASIEREAVRAAVQQLPLPYREVIILREFEDLSYQQIAAILNCPAGTAMSRLGRARERLRHLLSVPSG